MTSEVKAMKEIEEAKTKTEKSNGNKAGAEKKIPIIQTLKPKKRYTKLEKELIEATKAAMDVLTKQKNAKI
jgi:hypothetical protein